VARQRHLSAANAIVLGLSLVTGASLLLLAPSGALLRLVGLAPHPALTAAAVLLVLSVPLEGVKTNYLAVLQGILDVKGLALRRSEAVLAATALAVPLVWWFGLVGTAAQAVLLSAFVALLLGSRLRELGYAPLQVRADRAELALLASFGLASLASGFALGFADTAVRGALIRTAGPAANGLLQAPFTLATLLQTVVLASIGSVSLATVAPEQDGAKVSAALDRLLDVVLPLGAAALGLLGLAGAPALALLYSPAFSAAAVYLPCLLAADTLLVVVWVIGTPLLARGDRVVWLALELVHAGVRAALALALIPRWGAHGVVVATVVAVALHTAFNLGVLRWRHALSIAPVHLRRLGVALVLVALLAAIGARPATSPAATALAAAAWAAYAFHHARRTGLVAAARRRLPGRRP
jgi:O-antigen/teichoic acid export membrane protein